MERNKLKSRHIHLDFHTSEWIEDMGVQFDPDEFADTLEKSKVNSITLFTRCHHGRLYYDSKLFPEHVHPHLKDRNFLEQQVASCHRKGIDVNLYTTICWDKLIADEHPEWVCINENGELDDFKGKKYFEAGFYKNLCMNTAYRDYVKKQFGEAIRGIPAEGVWFDAAFIVECCCPCCIKKMKQQKLNPSNKNDRQKFAVMTYHDWVKDLSDFIWSIDPKLNVTFNKGHVGITEKEVKDYYTYYAIESLPGGEWGYMDFPISVKYNRNFCNPCFGMTGRFHTEWGDYHSFRNKEALAFECFSMISNGASCIIGDQLEPGGKLNPYMYQQIGEVFNEIEEKEPWCVNVTPNVEIGVFLEEEFVDVEIGDIPKATEGVARILQELSYQYDFIDSAADFAKYKVLVLPDVIPIDDKLKEKIERFLANGGKLLATYEAGLNKEKSMFMLDKLGVNYQGHAPYSPDFIIPTGEIGKGLYPSEHVMYMQGSLVEAKPEAKVLEKTIKPVFNRTWEHFSSHLHSPSSGEEGYPAIVATDQTIYFIHPLFSQYRYNATPWVRTFVKNALELLLPNQLVSHNGPTTLTTNIMQQQDNNRDVLHLLHYIPEKKSETLEIVDTVIPLYDTKIQLSVSNEVTSIKCQPENIDLDFTINENKISFTVPKILGHQLIEISYSA
ncbi:alpha-amylase family protein [Gracilibacillus phocaeensis]|uniref:alpha-amylase family protein n=1 Tax=Gracilibacillus phocaeensis TaxID=2042304 RepID=UPI0010317615|nr:alpha-amylase family protein [Gracilibacillus phocaeensis]